MADETYKGEFYCVKCKAKREAEGKVVVSDNGRRMAKGQAPKPNESGLWSFCANLLHNGVGTWKTRRLRA